MIKWSSLITSIIINSLKAGGLVNELYISLTNLLHLGNNVSGNIKPMEQNFKDIMNGQKKDGMKRQ